MVYFSQHVNEIFPTESFDKRKLFYAEILQDEVVLPSEETDIEIELSEVTEILPSSSYNENQNELLHQVYRAGSRRSLSYSSILTEIKTPTKNTMLHIAARYGNDKIVSLVVEHAPTLLFEFNENKESALHIAARSGHISIVEMLLAAYANFDRQDIKTAWLEYTKRLENYVEKSNGENLLKFVALENVEGNTMFHEAMLCRDKKRIGGDKIFKVYEREFDRTKGRFGESLSMFCYEIALVIVNHAKQSVLYLAIDSKDKEAVKLIMENCPNYVTMPQGLSPVVAAVMKHNQGNICIPIIAFSIIYCYDRFTLYILII